MPLPAATPLGAARSSSHTSSSYIKFSRNDAVGMLHYVSCQPSLAILVCSLLDTAVPTSCFKLFVLIFTEIIIVQSCMTL